MSDHSGAALPRPGADTERLRVDRHLRSELRRWAIVGSVSAVVLLGVAAVLLVLAGPRPGTFGVVGVALLVAVVMLDSVVRLPRPAPEVRAGAVVVPSSRLVGVLVVLMGLMVSLVALDLLTTDISDQRRAWLRYLVPLVAAGLIVLGLVRAARPPRLVVSPAALTLAGLRARTIAWDDVVSIAPTETAPSGAASTALSVSVRSAGTRLDLLTRWTSPTLWVVIDWLEHYRRHLDDRGELAGPGALDRLRAIEAEPRRDAPGPAWLPGPEATR